MLGIVLRIVLNNNNNNNSFLQGNSIGYKYSCYQEKLGVVLGSVLGWDCAYLASPFFSALFMNYFSVYFLSNLSPARLVQCISSVPSENIFAFIHSKQIGEDPYLTMQVDISQWRAAIGTFNLSSFSTRKMRKISVLLILSAIVRLCLPCCFSYYYRFSCYLFPLLSKLLQSSCFVPPSVSCTCLLDYMHLSKFYFTSCLS